MTGDISWPLPRCALTATLGRHLDAVALIESVLDSPALAGLGDTLRRANLSIEPEPIICKILPGPTLRLIFPVTGGQIEPGAVVAVVCLYDATAERTLYAHPMHAGPDVNPTLKNLNAPMAAPKAQPGADGDRATLRLMEHKRALWEQFDRQEGELGRVEAGRRWRTSYYWALKRLYFCSKCSRCRWGTPSFDGADASTDRLPTTGTSWPRTGLLGAVHGDWVANILESDAWSVEVGYARRGDFSVGSYPGLLKRIDSRMVIAIFPTDVTVIQAGSLVGLSVFYDALDQRVHHAHCLSAGPDAEIQFLRGELSLGLPPPQPGSLGDGARSVYRAWRHGAWSRYWLDELEQGIARASANWLGEFWLAMEAMFGGNDIGAISCSTAGSDS